MVTSITEGQAAQVPFQQHIPLDMLNSYRVEVAQDLLDEQGRLIDWLIGFAFDTLEMRVLDLRIVPSEQIHSAAHHRVLAGASARMVASKPSIHST
jgi:hypothetical protein